MQYLPPICLDCLHYQGSLKCKAYPSGIPEEIVKSKVDHTKPYKGDHGIQFEERKG